MTRSNYSDDYEEPNLWRGTVLSAIRGNRGQKLLREMLTALDAMPDKSLIAEALERDGDHCALGVVGAARGIQMADLDPEEYDAVAKVFNVAGVLVREIAYENDEGGRYDETCEQRWVRVRAWVAGQIKTEQPWLVRI